MAAQPPVAAATAVLASRGSPHDQERLDTAHHRLGQRRVGRLVGQVLLAGEEAEERAAAAAVVAADGAPEDRVFGLQGVEHRLQRRCAAHLDLHLVAHPGEVAQVERQDDPDHASVWTSTESTAGRSCTMAVQLSPPSAEPYTCPPVVPK